VRHLLENSESSKIRNKSASVVADGIFVGTGLGEAGLAAISIIVPFWLLSIGFFGLFGVGASTLSAVKLGNNDIEAARAVYGKVIAMAFYISVAICLILFLLLDSVLVRLGATPDILPDAKAYAIPYLVGLPFCVVGTIAYYYTRLAEKPLAASIGYIAPAIIAIVAEYVFIFKMDMGMAGSAIPWVLCVGLSVFLDSIPAS
jgi:Na+-driven multidrug efflux pump